MLNGSLKKESIENLKETHGRYEKRAEEVSKASQDLMNVRQASSEEVIAKVEEYINKLANTPKEFDKTFREYKAEFKVFNSLLYEIQLEARNSDIKAGGGAAAGIAAGVGTAAFAPTAAMAIATTFGTASTGTAISALSGAAATNAALAWLGGGALAAGGGGMAGGGTLLALSGPLGWAIGGAALVGSGLFARSKNRKIAAEADQQRKEIEVLDASLKAALVEISSLIGATEEHTSGIKNMLTWLELHAPVDYMSFSSEHKDKLGALINHIESLSALLNKKVEA